MKDEKEDRGKKLASAFFANVEDEGQANKKYAEMLAEFEDIMTKEEIDGVKEIMADEAQHSLKNQMFAQGRAGIKPTNDNLAQILSAIRG